MNFDSSIIAIKRELLLKHPIIRKEIKTTNPSEKRQELMSKIQFLVKKVLENIANGFPPVFRTLNAKWDNCEFDERVKLKESKITLKLINFKKRKSRSEFVMIMFLLSKIYKLLLKQQTTTRRALYYENLEVFKSQQQVDNAMKDICYLLNAPTWDLRVLATSKGMVAGPVVFTLTNGESVDCGRFGGVSIPQNVLEIEDMSSSASWVLVVEKDACFQTLISADASRRLGSCILITGKGFPDVNSRILVCKFWELLQIPVLVLVDADPHGFEIMCVYRFGSLSMSPYSGHLACPAVRWLGVHPSDIRPLLINSKGLSKEDTKKINSLFKRPYVEENEKLKTQLKILLEGNVKAEIEGVASISTNYLTDVYMKKKIQYKEYF